MRLDDEKRSSNVEDRRGQRRRPIGRRGGIGIGTIALALVAMYFGVDPAIVLNMGQKMSQQAPAPTQTTSVSANDPGRIFVDKVLNNTERTWNKIFANAGSRYRAPRLVLFTDATNANQCGVGQAAMGPFYCPADQTIYIDLSFYEDMKRKYQAPGDFAQAYVIAHEVGHHIQNLVGTSDQVQNARQRMSKVKANQMSVRLELQADCYAGVWASYAQNENRIEPGDVEEAMNAAAAIGDDALQKRAQGYAVPDSFTHGTSKQRMRWFNQGLRSGDIQQCDTFQVANL